MKKHACFLLGAVASLGTVFGQTREASPWDNPELPPETKNEIISLLGNSNSPQLAASKPDARQGIRTGKAQPAKLALEKTRPFASKDNARITIKVLIEWPDEFGYQLLLDSDATAYGDVIPENGYFWVEDEGYPDLDELYSEFEYAIPTDAADITGNYNVVLGGQIQHVDIPAGTYDAAVINPVAGTRDILYMAQGEDASLDNYVFEAGKEYVFTVDIDPGREHDNVVLGIKADYDLDVTAISAPTNSEDLGSTEDVTIRIENQGAKEISSYQVSYTLDEGSPVTEQVNEPISAGTSKDYTFSTKADLSQEGHLYRIQAHAYYADDTIGSNDAIVAEVRHLGPMHPPFFCDFNEESDMDLWNIVAGEATEVTWAWGEDSTAYIGFNYRSNPLDDYLVTKYPIVLNTGNAHIAFDYNGVRATYYETLEVLYGTTRNVDEMMPLIKLDSFSINPEGNLFSIKNFNIAENGHYYFAFHACSKADMRGIIVDNVEIGEGDYIGVPDIAITELLLPKSACDLPAETPLQVSVANKGRTDITKLRLSYTLDSASPVSEEFMNIPLGTDTVLTFTTTMDLSAFGLHAVKVEAEVLSPDAKEESNLMDNILIDSVTTYEPLDLPYSTDFYFPEQAADWDGDGNWKYDDEMMAYFYYTYYFDEQGRSVPLRSRCIALEEGKSYLFSMNYKAGSSIPGLISFPESFAILYGMTGTDIDTWDTIWSEDEAYDEAFHTQTASFTCQESGHYAFAVVLTSGFFFLRTINVEEAPTFDTRLSNFSLALPRMTTVEQINSQHFASVEVANIGSMAIDVQVNLSDQNGILFSDTVSLTEAGQSQTIGMHFSLAHLEAGDTVKLSCSASILDQDAIDPTRNNTAEKEIIITKDEMAYDAVEDFMFKTPEFYVFQSGFEKAMGLPFNLHVQDTLTHIAIGWGLPQERDAILRIYLWDSASQTLGRLLYEGTANSGSDAGFTRYATLEGLLLDPGHYMISVQCLSSELMSDRDADGYFYVLESGHPYLQQHDGFPAIRAVFGSEASVPAKDAQAEEIISPCKDGVFAANQEVSIRVCNRGYEEITFPTALVVNTESATEPQTITLPPYGCDTLTFTANMSALNTEYILTAITQLEGDENHANDTVSLTVHSFPPITPYEMNFEFCKDWATDNFNPAWTSVDADGNYLGGWLIYNYPLSGQQAGFFVFNPDLTEPSSLLEDAGEQVRPHSGDRFGASMVGLDFLQSNDWLISPLLTLPSADAKMSFYVKSYNDTYGLEQYNILVSTTDNEIESFIQIGETREAPAEAWTLVEVDLSEYAGKAVYLAIQCVSTYRFMFMIDDIVVSQPTGMEGGDRINAQLSLYPNPAHEMIQILSTDARINQISILNLTGGVVFESAASLNQTEFQYNVSSLDAGLYFARVRTDQGIAILKFIVR